MRTRISER